ncbi:ABC transporter permease subunit [Pseudomonas lijiangensis]|uniref:ABC transporter permease subunit n=1 Tax=Pseudomonas TaxID=286 RepID=UPI000BA39182|nr:ABC transporter permease subunit [Pseudomonas sp. Irchel 3A18]
MKTVLSIIGRYRLLIIPALFGVWALIDPIWKELASSWPFFLEGLYTTAIYSLAGVVLGLLFGGLLASLRLAGGLAGFIGGFIVVATQAVPPLFIISAAYLVSPEVLPFRVTPATAAVVALTVIGGSYYCEALRSAIAGVEQLQIEAAEITGLSRRTTLLRIILPQALISCVPALGAISIVVFKLSTLLYPLGITDFFRTTVLVNNRVVAPWQCYALIAGFYYVMSDVLQWVINRISARISGNSTLEHENQSAKVAVS